jgi:alkanesulfonate monooxygenase SsuD/methylene tetrahydromethanopterin reductase-like flavin-dependent oxidoreductase (luciferase family)
MQYGLDVANQGVAADPRRVVELALAAEAAGWDGLFLWDHWGFAWGMPSGDPWVMLAAVAQATTRLHLGTVVTPLARRRPQMVANSVATLDLLSNGRMVLGAGLGGVPAEFAAFGEPTDGKTRAAMLDEGLDVVSRLLAGERVNHQGKYYTVNDVQLQPRGLQLPRVPIWIGAESGNALRRAARWDGWVIYTVDTRGVVVRSAAEVAQTLATIRQYRDEAGMTMAGYEVVVTGASEAGEGVEAYRASGATWWLETLHGMRESFDMLMARVEAGPPR